MKFDKEHWKEIDINIDSLWLIGPRAKGGKRENNYHGNFVPQIPDHLIRRYTEEGDIVLEPFMGSGTTLYECERLKRNYIGFDINTEIVEYVKNKMQDCSDIMFNIHECDCTDSEVVPLGFYLMHAIKKNIKCKLKGIVVKDMVGNRAKLGMDAL